MCKAPGSISSPVKRKNKYKVKEEGRERGGRGEIQVEHRLMTCWVVIETLLIVKKRDTTPSD
jgi:hypothetical protein